MAEFKISITAEKIVEALTFNGKDYMRTWRCSTAGSIPDNSEIAQQIKQDYPDFDNYLLNEIDNIPIMYYLELRVLMARLSEIEKGAESE